MHTRLERAERLHAALTARLAELRRAERGALLHFATIHREQLYRELGFATIHAYGRERLGFSERKLSAFVRLAEALERLPATRAAVEAGALPWTKARELVSVATPTSEQHWLAEAKAVSRRELERKVCAARARPGPQRRAAAAQPDLALAPTPAERARSDAEAEAPLRLTFNLSAEQYGRWEALVERLRKTGHRESREELLLAALAALAAEAAVAAAGPADAEAAATRPRGRVASPLQVILRRCPDCGATVQITSRGERPAGPALAARAACDSEEHAPGGGLTRTLTSALRRRILARDGHRCQAPGCTATHFLEVHHLKPRARGGSQAEANLVTLCARCHQLLHERGGLPGLAAAVVVAAAATPVSPAARGSP